GHSSVDLNAGWAAGVDGPVSLNSSLQPNPFTVQAYVSNHKTTTLTNTQVSLSLPPGLQLATGDTAAKTIGDVPPDAERLVSWNVQPTGSAYGLLTYGVSFAAGPSIEGKVVTRQIEVPAQPTVTYGAGRFQLVSYPFQFTDGSPDVVLGAASS